MLPCSQRVICYYKLHATTLPKSVLLQQRTTFQAWATRARFSGSGGGRELNRPFFTRSGSPLSTTVIPPKPPNIFIENSNSQTGNARNQTTLSASPKPEQLHEYTIHTSTYSWLAGYHENSAYQTHCNIVGSASHPTSTKWRYACNAQMEPVTIYTQRAEPESNKKGHWPANNAPPCTVW